MGKFNLVIIFVCCFAGVVLIDASAFTKWMVFLPIAISILLFYFFRYLKQRNACQDDLRKRIENLEDRFQEKKS